jgi:hypothetical protein
VPPGANIPGWSEHVEELRQESLRWHHYWKDSGQPHDGDIAEMHRMSRARYHRAIRHIMKNSDNIRMERMAEAIADNRSRDLWKEVKKIKGRNNFAPANIDGVTSDYDISNTFSEKYRNLYNSVPYDQGKMNDIQHEINNRLNSSHEYNVSVDDVVSAIKRLKLGKSDGEEGLNSDHIINGPHLLYVFLTIIFNCMLIHGVSPDSMIIGTMVPIPKCKTKQLCCSDNYRAITLSSVIGKIFDWLVLIKEQKALNSSQLQFGFKAHTSTTQCTFVMNETISYFNSKRSNVYVVLLDATKAFDRVNYCKLFKKLLDRNVSPLVLRLLLYMYTKQSLKVRWGTITSDQFNVTNGVKQGGVLSPTLFSVYMDDLFGRLMKRGVGCRMGNYFVGCLAYADDLTLLAPSKKALQIMIDICQGYASEYDVIFNGPKSQFLVFRGRDCKVQSCYIMVNNEPLSNINTAVHLGHKISTDDKDYTISAAVSQFWRSFNIFRADLGNIYPFVQCKLFRQYCCSFYGAPLWAFSSHYKICTPWRKSLRKIWNVSPMTHCRIIALLSECKPLEMSLQQRFCKFVNGILRYGSNLINHVANIAQHNPFSVYCDNYTAIVGKYGANFNETRSIIEKEWKDSICDNTMSNVNVLSEMIDVRDGRKECSNLSREEVIYIIDDICLN